MCKTTSSLLWKLQWVSGTSRGNVGLWCGRRCRCLSNIHREYCAGRSVAWSVCAYARTFAHTHTRPSVQGMLFWTLCVLISHTNVLHTEHSGSAMPVGHACGVCVCAGAMAVANTLDPITTHRMVDSNGLCALCAGTFMWCYVQFSLANTFLGL